MKSEDIEPRRRITATFKVGAIALAFLIIGYEAALFVHRASVLRIQERRDHPDTVFVYGEAVAANSLNISETKNDSPSNHRRINQDLTDNQALSRHLESASEEEQMSGGEADPGSPRGTPLAPPTGGSRGSDRGLRSGGATAGPGRTSIRRDSPHGPAVESVRRNTRRVESFRFDPNTVSVEDLQRLGFSAKQAASIDNYRAKGGRFRRPDDFGRSFVVADSVFRRLRPFIDIPRVDINVADSATFDALPGIGAWTAAQMVSYRTALGGYSCCEQLMDVYKFDRQRYDAIADLICCGPGAIPFDLWGLPAEDLKRHPCIRTWSVARAVVLFRSNTPPSQWSVAALQGAGILDSLAAAHLSRCLLVPPPGLSPNESDSGNGSHQR